MTYPTHIVQKGENLSQIANRYGMKLDELYKINNIDPEREYLYPNEGVKVIDNRPEQERLANPIPEVNDKPQDYVVQPNESYYKIAEDHNINAAELMELNNKKPFEERMLYPGQVIRVIDRNHAQRLLANTNCDPMGKGGCSLQSKITIFPVRYAIDEAPNKKDEETPKPLPDSWIGPVFSPIKTRNYTLRQLRDGWLYIWVNGVFEEYHVAGKKFTHTDRQEKTLDETFKKDGVGVITVGEKGAKDYLELSIKSIVYVAFSQERWTENYYQQLFDNKNSERSKFMREVNLPSYINGNEIGHVDDLKKIADYVADIDKTSVQNSTDFESTMVQVSPTVEGVDKKEIVTDNSIIAQIPGDNLSILLALDDHLGLLHDLTLQLTGRNDELMQFNEVHQHRLYIAGILEQFCGNQLHNSTYPEQVANTPEAKRAFTKELGVCLDEAESAVNSYGNALGRYRATYSSDKIREGGLRQAWNDLASLGIKNLTPNKTAHFRQQYSSFTFEEYKEAYERWEKIKKSREIVKYDEAIAYLDKEKIKAPLEKHVEEASTDLTNYISALGADPLVVFLDNTFEMHSALLTTIFTSIHQQLSMYSVTAQAWLENDLSVNNTLISLIPYNFSKPLAIAIETMAKYYEANQKLEPDEPEFNDETLFSNILGTANIINNKSAVTDAIKAEQAEQEKIKQSLKTAITYKRIQNTKTFQALPEAAQQAYLVYPEALKASTNAWEGWQRSVLYRTRTLTHTTTHTFEALSTTVIHLVVYGQVVEETHVQVSNPNFEQEMQEWLKKNERLKKLIAAKEAEVALPRTDKKAYQAKIKAARRRMSYRRGRNPVVQSRLNAKASLPQLRKELASLEEARPVRFKITGFFKKTTTEPIMDIYLVKMLFRRFTLVQTTTLSKSQAIGYVYSKVGSLPSVAQGVPSTTPGGSMSPSSTTTTNNTAATSAADSEAVEGFLARNGIGVIGVILVGLNAINVINTIAKPIINGQVDKNDIQSMIMSTSALTSLLFSFKTNALWKVVSQEMIRTEKVAGRWQYRKLIEVSRSKYGTQWSRALGGSFEQQANQFLKLGTVMSVFGFIANAVETWQIIGTKVNEATNSSERMALYIKGLSTLGMAGIFGYQFLATAIKRAWLGKAFGGWAAVAMFVLSIIYLGADFFASLFRYEGFELWCKRCIWSKDTPYWQDTEQGNQEEIRALQEILLAPQLIVIPRSGLLNDGTKDWGLYLDMYLIMPPLDRNSMAQFKLDISIDNIFGSGSTPWKSNGVFSKEPDFSDFVNDLNDNQHWVLREDFEIQCKPAYSNFVKLTDNNEEFAEVSGEVDPSQLIWFSRGLITTPHAGRTNLEIELFYPPELLTPRKDKQGYRFRVDTTGPMPSQSIFTLKPIDNTMENSQDPTSYTIKESDRWAVNDAPYLVNVLPPLFED